MSNSIINLNQDELCHISGGEGEVETTPDPENDYTVKKAGILQKIIVPGVKYTYHTLAALSFVAVATFITLSIFGLAGVTKKIKQV
jgi:hypothetical protein